MRCIYLVSLCIDWGAILLLYRLILLSCFCIKKKKKRELIKQEQSKYQKKIFIIIEDTLFSCIVIMYVCDIDVLQYMQYKR